MHVCKNPEPDRAFSLFLILKVRMYQSCPAFICICLFLPEPQEDSLIPFRSIPFRSVPNHPSLYLSLNRIPVPLYDICMQVLLPSQAKPNASGHICTMNLITHPAENALKDPSPGKQRSICMQDIHLSCSAHYIMFIQPVVCIPRRRLFNTR